MASVPDLKIDVCDFLIQSRVRVCLAYHYRNNWRHSNTNVGLCNCKEIEIDDNGQCLNFYKRGE